MLYHFEGRTGLYYKIDAEKLIKVQQAWESMAKESPEAQDKMEDAVLALKEGFM